MAANGASTSVTATVARNLKAARKAAGFTQHGLAVALGRGDNMTVSRWERGEHKPSDENLVALAEILGVSVASFFSDPEREAA
jgi:transcriptional regulator with XRE-family HTH domain